jgi:hypothetical protein
MVMRMAFMRLFDDTPNVFYGIIESVFWYIALNKEIRNLIPSIS